ncbi:STAS domain-containing protein [bacterium]|nr:STAS domain-containing protein [bacterium]
MKFTSYATKIHNNTAFIFGGKALDFDLQGGLEEKLESLLENDVNRIVLTMRGAKFLHSTLFAGLLRIQRKIEAKGGDFVLAEVPWFMIVTLKNAGVRHRFNIVPSESTVMRTIRNDTKIQDSAIPG